MISSVKALSTADLTVALLFAARLSLVPGSSDVTVLSGHTLFSDVPSGHSGNDGPTGATLQQNTYGINYTPGLVERHRGGAVLRQEAERLLLAQDGATAGRRTGDPIDTLGESPRVPHRRSVAC